jgi:hypothetical protein
VKEKMATFNGTMSEPPRGDRRFILCRRYLAEAIRNYDSSAVVAEELVIDTRGPYEDKETFSLLRDGTLFHPKPDADPGRGIERLIGIWKVQGKVSGQPGIYPAYQAELLVAEYDRRINDLVPLGKRVDLKWVSPVSVQ